jgi:HSP20 family protein
MSESHLKGGTMATLVRWEPFREIATLQNEMSRLMDTALGGNGETATRAWVPAVDVWETEGELVYAFDLPGIPEEKISVEFEDGALVVSGERERSKEASQENYYRFERRFGSFTRTVGLPQGAAEDSISADYHDGVLEVHVQKPEQPKPRRIEIGKGGKQKTIEGTAKQK